MKPKQLYVPVSELKRYINMPCLHLDLDDVSDDIIINNLKNVLNSEEYPNYYIFKHKSSELNADGKNIFLGVFLLGTVQPFDNSKMVFVFKKYADSHPNVHIVKNDYYLTKEEYLQVELLKDNKNNQSLEQNNNKKVNTFGTIGKKTITDTSRSSMNTSDEDLNEEAKHIDERNVIYGVIVDPNHLEKISNIDGVEIIGRSDLSHKIYFRATPQATNAALGQSVRLQNNIKDSEVLEFYKKN